ncbi:MAG: GNAT family N-acetyltransferase [Campylobacterales bacterium]|nr:GNAT family N-acetyltransferase [Campylobacterales bacterium]
MALHVTILTTQNVLAFDGFYAIYTEAFPLSEQKSKETLLAMLDASFYTIYLAYHDEKIVGFCIMYHPQNTDFFLLEYIAITPHIQAKGLGSFLLKESIELLFEKEGIRPILIEIDSPEHASFEQEIREKRERFYRKMGALKIKPFDYILPLHSDETPPPMKLLLLHYPYATLEKATLKRWLETLYNGAYNCPKDDPRIAQMLADTPSYFKFD